MNVSEWGIRPGQERSPISAERLERLRTKLLDLSTTNRMLSFRHPRASCLRVIDELPQVLFQSLLNGEQLQFEPLVEPTRRDLEAWHAERNQVPRASTAPELKRPDAASWARHLGLRVDYDLPVEADDFERPERHADKKIQTLFYGDELDARLRKIRASARTAIEESGANMLYMAFGFLEWRDVTNSRSHQAPLILLPVELQREVGRGGRYRSKVRWTGEELQPNLSLRKKLEEFNIKLPELQEDQGLEDYLLEVARAVRHKSDWLVRRYVTLGLFEFGKILLYLDLDPDRWPSHAPIDAHPLVRTILEGGEEGAPEGRAGPPGETSEEIAEYRDLKLELVDRADGSQCEALEEALAGQNLVIEGPPGTGKSQTITNLVAAALARGKTVLFVAEKLAALEVVRRRMRELGLGDFCLELHSHKTRKMEVLEDIADRIRASARLRPPKELEIALERLADRRRRLSAYIEIVARPCGEFRGLTIADALMRAGRARRKLGAHVRTVEESVREIASPDKLTWGELADSKARLTHLAAALRELANDGSAFRHPWAGVSVEHILPHDALRVAASAERWATAADHLAEVLSEVKLPELPANELRSAPDQVAILERNRSAALKAEEVVRQIEERLGLSLSRSAGGATAAATLVQFAKAAPLQHLSIRNPFLISAGAAEWLRHHRARVHSLGEQQSKLEESVRESAFNRHIDDLEEWAAALDQRGLFVRFGRRWRAATQAWAEMARPAQLKANAAHKSSILSRLRSYLQEKDALDADPAVLRNLGTSEFGEEYDLDAAVSVGEWAEEVRSNIPEPLCDALLSAPAEAIECLAKIDSGSLLEVADFELDPSRPTYWTALAYAVAPKSVAELAAAADDEGWRTLCRQIGQCAEAAGRLLDAEQNFIRQTGLDLETWFGSEQRPALRAVASRARLASLSAEQLPKWLEFDRALRASSGKADESVALALAAATLPPQAASEALEFLIFDGLARQAFADHPALHAVSGQSLDELRADYRALDAQAMELRRAEIAAELMKRKPPEGRQSGLKSELTQMALIRSELGKQRRHIPIRRLVERAGEALQQLKPCFMMGPLSVAQYLAPGTLKFDLIIMDEASQMRPEDAIGALARGGQAVIVGDPKQLPPTSFFDRIAEGNTDDSDEQEITLAEDSKSILELASGLFGHRMLRWHYRSRHEALIAFSNRQFYKDELIVFPSPAGQAGRYGIGWNFVNDGVTNKGVNVAEAKAVAAAAAKFLLRHPNRSLGIVAMNIKQVQRISDELATLADADPLLAKSLSVAENGGSSEPFFVKNLENVQGDERDVIMISMTYGPPLPGGRTPQNFGPINQDTGWRRLNVLFTRAKERMEIFSSMRGADVVPKEGSDRGPRALKRFLEYAETGSLGTTVRPTGRDPDSDFEDAVLEGLAELNYDCEPQLGVANFYLDIAVRDPANKDEFIAAIECDGAAYHSEKSARDRDRLRQEILEGYGWDIIRIWSTDWFRDPNGELERVNKELQRLIAARAENRNRATDQRGPRTAAVETTIEQNTRIDAHPQLPLLDAHRLPVEPSVERRTNSRSYGISVEQARAKLIDLRERTIKPQLPDADPATGLLRKSMLDELLKKRPTDSEEFRRLIRLDLRQNTDGAQLKEFGEKVFEILSQIDA